ncbi:MAG: hypothetical protein NTY35_07710 [Planctomycetota bacterium]|nr:hypothetical protein [Planctomycetota bacterium]
MRIPRLLAWLFLAPIALATPAGEPSNGLARARALFSAADRDGDARLALPELRDRLFAVTEREFRDEDADRNGSWSREEFTVYYRNLLVRTGERPAADLEAEVVRLLALRRARTVDESRPRPGPAASRLAWPVDPTSGVPPEIVELDVRLERALADLEDHAAGKGAVREDFERVRGLWNERVTRIRALGEPSPGPADVPARFLQALDVLAGKARAGSVPRAEFAQLRAAWEARPLRPVTGPKPPGDKPRDPLPAASIEARFDRALAELEAKTFARAAARADWAAVQELVPERARRLVQGPGSDLPAADDPRVVRTAGDLRTAIERMEQLAGAGSIARSDFAGLRGRLTTGARQELGPSERGARR